MNLFPSSNRLTLLGSILFLTIVIWTAFQVANTTITTHAQEIEPTSLTVCANGGDFTSIQPAIDAIASGSTIDICPGTYLENIIIDKDVTLIGSDPATTIIKDAQYLPVIQIQGNSKVALSGFTVRNGERNITIAAGSDVTLDNMNVTSSFDGGIYNDNGLLQIKNSVLSRNTAQFRGGGIWNIGGEVSIENSEISNNFGGNDSSGGGGIYNTGVMTVSNSIIIDNRVNGSYGGGVINTTTGVMLITQSTISGNEVGSGPSGGGLGISNSGTLTLIDSDVDNHRDPIVRGSGIYNTGNLSLLNSRVNNNLAELGGGIYSTGNITAIDSEIASNHADIGGGIFNRSSEEDNKLELINTSVTANVASRTGGGIHNKAGLTVMSSTINGNDTEGSGGGIYNDGGELSITDSFLTQNSAGIEGGGLLDWNGSGLIDQSTISDNQAGSSGGIGRGGSDNVTNLMIIRNSTLSNNRATTVGGGIYNNEPPLEVINTTIYGNEAAFIGGLGADTAQVTIINSTIVGNSATTRGGGVGDFGIGMTFVNTIVANNMAPVGPDCDFLGTVSSLGNNFIGDPTDCSILLQPTDLTGKPKLDEFVDDGTPGGGYFPLRPNSRAIDAANGEECPATDQRGVIRPQGAGCDIGAFELEDDGPPPVTCGPLTQEGEDGTLFGKFAIGDDPNASGGQYVSVPERPISAAGLSAPNMNRKNRADYCVTIAEAGDYRLRVQVMAPDHKSNSFLVQVDGMPTNGTFYDIFPADGTYVTDYVTQRGGADPVIYTLEPGDHTISFIRREDGTRLDSFALEPATVQAANITMPAEIELRENLIAEGEIPDTEPFIFVPLITR